MSKRDMRHYKVESYEYRVGSAEGEVEPNDPKRPGQHAGPYCLFGNHSRYKLYPMHTRFDAVVWIVEDAMKLDDVTGLPEIIRMEPTIGKAWADLPDMWWNTPEEEYNADSL